MAESQTSHLGPLVTQLRLRRKVMEERWLLNHAAWLGRHQRVMFKSEMFSHYIPVARRSVERHTIRAAQMLLPSNEFFEVYPGDEITPDSGKSAESVRAALYHVFTKRLKPYVTVRQLVRCYLNYSFAAVKTGVEVVPIYDNNGTKVEEHVWPTWRAVDPFVLYRWPETVSDVDRCEIVAEDHMMPWSQYEKLQTMKLVEVLDPKHLSKPEWPTHLIRRLQDQGLSMPDDTATKDPADESKQAGSDFVALTEIYAKEANGWRMFWLVWNYQDPTKRDTPMVVRTAKRLRPRPPYRLVSAREIPGQMYTTAMMDDLEPLQVLVNDQFNMMLEGQATAFSPPAAIDADKVTRADTMVYRPRAKWLVDPTGVKFLEVPDTTRSGVMGIQVTLGMMDSFSGSNPLAEGQPTRNLPKAGFAVSSLLNLSLADIRDTAQMLEDEVLTPSLQDVFQIMVEFTPAKQVFKIPGTQSWPARQLSIADLEGDWSFRWVGSLQSQDYQVKAQRMMAALQGLGKMAPVIMQDLARRGKRINFEALLRRLWREGLGERGAESLVEDMKPEEQIMRAMEMLVAAQGGGALGNPGPGSDVPVTAAGAGALDTKALGG